MQRVGGLQIKSWRLKEVMRVSENRLTLQERLDDLRRVIPNFDALCQLFVDKWLVMMELRRVLRMGYWKLWSYKVAVRVKKKLHVRRIPCEKFLPWNTPFTDADHVYGLGCAVILFRDIFGDFIPHIYNYQPQWYELMEKTFIHELGEIRIGDWEDDGSHDLRLKAQLENEFFNEFIADFPRSAKQRHVQQFADASEDDDEFKVFDKEAFLLGNIYARVHDFEGDMTHRRNLSAQDREIMKRTGSKRCVDNIYAGMLERFTCNPLMPFFMGINEAAYAKYYNEETDPLVENYEPGEVPPGVKEFYKSA